MSDNNGSIEIWLQNDLGLRPRFTQATDRLEAVLNQYDGEILSVNKEGEATVKVCSAGKDWLKAHGHDFIETLPVAGIKELAVFNAEDVKSFHIFDTEIKPGLTA